MLVLPIKYFSNTTGVWTKLKQNNLQTASRIHFCTFLTIFYSHLSCLSLNLFSNPKNKVLFSFSRCEFIEITSAIQYKCRYKYRSVIALIKAKIQFPVILFGKIGTIFVTQGNMSKQSRYREASAHRSPRIFFDCEHSLFILLCSSTTAEYFSLLVCIDGYLAVSMWLILQ